MSLIFGKAMAACTSLDEIPSICRVTARCRQHSQPGRTATLLQLLPTRSGQISGPWSLHRAHMVLSGEAGAWAMLVASCSCRRPASGNPSRLRPQSFRSDVASMFAGARCAGGHAQGCTTALRIQPRGSLPVQEWFACSSVL